MGRIKNEDIMTLLNSIVKRMDAYDAPASAKAAPAEATVATRVQQAATSPAKARKPKGAKGERKLNTEGPMLDGLRLFQHPTQPGYSRLYFYDDKGNQLARVRDDDATAQTILKELRATPLSVTGRKQMHFLRAERCWSAKHELFPKRITDNIKLEGPK